ncbi:MAG: acylneuraminate cytidylyltransferase family protein [Gemmatimonadaceae bacterium]
MSAHGRLAVIPARGGSRRVPGKNVRPLLGRPALAYTVDAALHSGLFDRVVVSTDSESVADIARQCGAEVPFLRDAGLADDHTPVSDVTVDVLRRLDPSREWCAVVAQLMPNCPLRTAGDVTDSFRAFVAAGSRSQLSVTEFGWQNPWWAMRLGAGGELVPLFPLEVTRRSQELTPLVCPTGAIWWATAETLHVEGTFHVPGRTGWVMPWERAIDVDTEGDWTMLELLTERARRGANAYGARVMEAVDER